MHILRHPEHCPDTMKQSVIALGNFDGVHRGHRQVIETARSLADRHQVACTVMTFEPHPAVVLRPMIDPAMRITPFRSKICQLQQLHADLVCVLNFSKAFSLLTAEQFIETILVRCLEIQHVVIGEDFNFGYNRTGNAAFLRQMAPHYGFDVTCVGAVFEDNTACSSTRIRQFLKTGNIEKAVLLLGHDYMVTGRVIAGEQRGRQLGFPTANIALSSDLLRPAYGVYAVMLSIENGLWYKAVANIGLKPTFSGHKETLEVHIPGFDGDIYGKRVEVKFIRHIRTEQKFTGIDALKAQISQDVKEAQSILEHHHHA